MRATDSGDVLDLGYGYDKNGNVDAVTDHTTLARQTRSMTYDSRDRLLTLASPLYVGGATYAYDVLDNLTRVTVAGRDHRYVYDASNRLTNVTDGPSGPSVIGLGYDARGNLSNKNGDLYQFDQGNRLRTALGTESYRYDAWGRRTLTFSAGASLFEMYSRDGKLLWQRDELTGMRFWRVYLGGSLVASRRLPIGSTTETATYRHTDALGSPIAATNDFGGMDQLTEHEPYGRMLNRANDNRPGYTGHMMDKGTGLVYMQQRFYDPGIGRFLSVDPVTAYSNPVGAFNRYWYANSNPYRFKDPDGRKCATADGKDSCTFDEFTNRKGDKITRQEALGGKISQLFGRGSRILRAEAGMTAKYTAAKGLAAKNGEVTIKGNSTRGIPDQKVSESTIVSRMETIQTRTNDASNPESRNSVASVKADLITGGPASGPIDYWKDGSAGSDMAQVFGHEILHTIYSGAGVPNNGYANPRIDHQAPFDDASDDIH